MKSIFPQPIQNLPEVTILFTGVKGYIIQASVILWLISVIYSYSIKDEFLKVIMNKKR